MEGALLRTVVDRHISLENAQSADTSKANILSPQSYLKINNNSNNKL
jgi:hypothetical protein